MKYLRARWREECNVNCLGKGTYNTQLSNVIAYFLVFVISEREGGGWRIRAQDSRIYKKKKKMKGNREIRDTRIKNINTKRNLRKQKRWK